MPWTTPLRPRKTSISSGDSGGVISWKLALSIQFHSLPSNNWHVLDISSVVTAHLYIDVEVLPNFVDCVYHLGTYILPQIHLEKRAGLGIINQRAIGKEVIYYVFYRSQESSVEIENTCAMSVLCSRHDLKPHTSSLGRWGTRGSRALKSIFWWTGDMKTSLSGSTCFMLWPTNTEDGERYQITANNGEM